MKGIYVLIFCGLMACTSSKTPLVVDDNGEAMKQEDLSEYTIQLLLKETETIPRLGWRINISESSHKSQADRGAVAVLIDDGERKAETRWSFSSKGFDQAWKPVGGRIFNAEKGIYEEVYLSGWRIRLDSIDTRRSNNAPASITCTISKEP